MLGINRTTHIDDRIGGPYLESDEVNADEPVNTEAQDQLLALATDMVSVLAF